MWDQVGRNLRLHSSCLLFFQGHLIVFTPSTSNHRKAAEKCRYPRSNSKHQWVSSPEVSLKQSLSFLETPAPTCSLEHMLVYQTPNHAMCHYHPAWDTDLFMCVGHAHLQKAFFRYSFQYSIPEGSVFFPAVLGIGYLQGAPPRPFLHVQSMQIQGYHSVGRVKGQQRSLGG